MARPTAWNVHAMARGGTGAVLSATLRQVVRHGGAVELHEPQVSTGPGMHRVLLTLRTIDGAGDLAGMVRVVFRDSPIPPARRRHRAGRAQRAPGIELQRARKKVQTQDEELQTVNTDLEIKPDDLVMVKSDRHNMLVRIDATTLLLGSALRARRFNDPAWQVINLGKIDAGRPCASLTRTLDHPALLAEVQSRLRTLAPQETQVYAADGRCFAARINPYRAINNVIDVAVVSFVDVTVQRAAPARTSRPAGH